jgi:hypothetical protein
VHYKWFELEVTISSYTIIVLVNIDVIISYYRKAGSASKSPMHENCFKHCFFVAMYWTFSIVLSTILVWVGWSSNLSDDDDPNNYIIIIKFALNLVCNVVPYIIILDSQFIKILTFDAHRLYEFELK